tara:strand:- start:2377 stop:2829 length:453 start_codon:yes stop_codon:yes gene_type:complete
MGSVTPLEETRLSSTSVLQSADWSTRCTADFSNQNFKKTWSHIITYSAELDSILIETSNVNENHNPGNTNPSNIVDLEELSRLECKSIPYMIGQLKAEGTILAGATFEIHLKLCLENNILSIRHDSKILEEPSIESPLHCEVNMANGFKL